MRIGFDARMMGIEQRGIGRYIEQLLRLLVQSPLHQWWIIVRRDPPGWLRMLPNARILEVDTPWYTFKEQMVIPRIFAKLPVDVLHVPHVNVPLRWMFRLRRPPLVVTVHDCILAHDPTSSTTTRSLPLWYTKRWAHGLTMRALTARSQAIIVPSENVAKDLRRFYHALPQRVRVIPEGVSIPEHRCQGMLCRPRATQQYVLTVGSAYPHKNLELVGRAIEACDDGFQWVHVGVPDAFWQALVRRLPLSVRSRLLALGQVSDDELSGWYAHAQALLVPSRIEGYGLVVDEALSQGTPVVCSDIPVFRELYGGRVAILPPDDCGLWVRMLRALCSGSRQGRVSPAPHLPTWSDAAAATMEVYRNAVR